MESPALRTPGVQRIPALSSAVFPENPAKLSLLQTPPRSRDTSPTLVPKRTTTTDTMQRGHRPTTRMPSKTTLGISVGNTWLFTQCNCADVSLFFRARVIRMHVLRDSSTIASLTKTMLSVIEVSLSSDMTRFFNQERIVSLAKAG